MKKILSIITLFTLLLLPIKIKAAETIEIKSIEIVEQTEEGIEKSKPTFKDLKVYFDLNFSELKQSIKYKVVLKNNDEQDYEVEDSVKKSEDNFLEYKISNDSSSNIVKAGEERTVYITVTYVEEVPADKFVDGVYRAQNNIKILFNSKEKNPNTLAYGLVAIAIPLLVLSVVLLIVSKNKMAKLMSIAITGMLIIPLIGIALEKVEIEIASEITIQPPVKELTLYYDDCSCSASQPLAPKSGTKGTSDTKDCTMPGEYTSDFASGMTWVEFIDSDYFAENQWPNDLFDANWEEDFYYYDKEFDDCMDDADATEYDDSLTQAENYEIYADKVDACYIKYEHQASPQDRIISNEKGTYFLHGYCVAPTGEFD